MPNLYPGAKATLDSTAPMSGRRSDVVVYVDMSSSEFTPSSALKIDVLCVYGPSYTESVSKNLLPALERQEDIETTLNLINYSSNEPLFSGGNRRISVVDWSAERINGRMGFGEAINYLFRKVDPKAFFVVANPDTVPTANAIKTLVKTALRRGAAIVEARQWPYEHPKEYDAETLQTPWASGAFFVAMSSAFEQVGGFDELFFMYNEDVDLSWRMRLAGKDVLYQPEALVHHYTGLGKYHPNVHYLEHFYSTRNFIVLSYKYWGGAGEKLAMEYLSKSQFPDGFKTSVVLDYEKIKPKIDRQKRFPPDRWIKILGLNQYHALRAI